MKYFSLLAVLLVSVSACKTKHNVSSSPTKPVEVAPVPAPVAILDWKSAYEACRKNNLQFTTYTASGKLSANVNGQDPFEVSYRLNIKNDSMIWLKVTKFGLEGMRALITPQKIQLIDNLNSQAYVMDFDKIGSLIGMTVDFHTLQDLLVGNMPTLTTDSVQFEEEKDTYRLSFVQAERNFLYCIEKNKEKLQSILTDKPNDAQKAMMKFGEYQAVQTYQSPFSANVTFAAKQTGHFELTHTKVSLNETDLQFNFTIPEDFKILDK